jgi:heme exporter protein D
MMEATAHIDFIAAAYAAAVIIVGILIAWVSLDFRAQQSVLIELDRQGVARRSGPGRTDPASQSVKEEATEKA